MRRHSGRRFRGLSWSLVLGAVLALGNAGPVSGSNVLMFGPSIGPAPNEATIAAADGHTVTVDIAATWLGRSTASFATFDALVIGNLGCVLNTGPLATVEATAATWGAAVSGNVVVYGTDPVRNPAKL